MYDTYEELLQAAEISARASGSVASTFRYIEWNEEGNSLVRTATWRRSEDPETF
ncbi:hypothetical protein [Nocardia brasiliensis]|uniref:hypothetical protein n=1 Tax=Nocardia brasiliensis TaxID=37326 RepID=UPI0024537A22|nr:hypothetical protein [Nocardia brasiliensis]